MKRILHILKERDDAYPLELIRKQAESDHVVVILIRDAIDVEIPDAGVSVCVLSEDGNQQIPKQASPHPVSHRRIGYKEMLETIFACDTVLTW